MRPLEAYQISELAALFGSERSAMRGNNLRDVMYKFLCLCDDWYNLDSKVDDLTIGEQAQFDDIRKKIIGMADSYDCDVWLQHNGLIFLKIRGGMHYLDVPRMTSHV